jgi:hypothetical protein
VNFWRERRRDSEVPSEEEQLLSLSKGLVLAEEMPLLQASLRAARVFFFPSQKKTIKSRRG